MNCETVIADIQTPDGAIAIDTRESHCGNCEHCDGEPDADGHGYCRLFGAELESEIREDGHLLDMRRLAECLAAQAD